MVGIVPSILSADFTRLEEQVREAESAGAARFQIDIMDGHFVPAITVGPMVIQAVRRRTRLPLEAHLMISNPENSIEACVKAGSDIIIVHQESTVHFHPGHPADQRCRGNGGCCALALNASPID